MPTDKVFRHGQIGSPYYLLIYAFAVEARSELRCNHACRGWNPQPAADAPEQKYTS